MHETFREAVARFWTTRQSLFEQCVEQILEDLRNHTGADAVEITFEAWSNEMEHVFNPVGAKVRVDGGSYDLEADEVVVRLVAMGSDFTPPPADADDYADAIDAAWEIWMERTTSPVWEYLAHVLPGRTRRGEVTLGAA